jgi:hypothetical protein
MWPQFSCRKLEAESYLGCTKTAIVRAKYNRNDLDAATNQSGHPVAAFLAPVL